MTWSSQTTGASNWISWQDFINFRLHFMFFLTLHESRNILSFIIFFLWILLPPPPLRPGRVAGGQRPPAEGVARWLGGATALMGARSAQPVLPPGIGPQGFCSEWASLGWKLLNSRNFSSLPAQTSDNVDQKYGL